jgi:hypothetical protein
MSISRRKIESITWNLKIISKVSGFCCPVDKFSTEVWMKMNSLAVRTCRVIKWFYCDAGLGPVIGWPAGAPWVVGAPPASAPLGGATSSSALGLQPNAHKANKETIMITSQRRFRDMPKTFPF